MDVVKIAALGLMAVAAGLFFCQVRPEYTVYISLAAGLLILICGAGKLEAIFVMIRQIESYLPVKAAYVTAILKMVGGVECPRSESVCFARALASYRMDRRQGQWRR